MEGIPKGRIKSSKAILLLHFKCFQKHTDSLSVLKLTENLDL
jgi:hypothetical protein